jgi:acyl-CoA thioesterase-2
MGRLQRRPGHVEKRRQWGVTRALDDLVALLDLEPIEVTIFRGRSPDEKRQRVFGGLVAGQALVAAGRTINNDGRPTRAVHSLHAYFLRPGDPTVPILYEVDRLRDGRSFTTRRVVAIQHGKAIFNLSASFQVHEEGVDHQASMPDVPAPETLPTFEARFAPIADQLGDWYTRPRPIEIRHITEPTRLTAPARLAPTQQVWMRAHGRLPDDALLHDCVVAYASDMTLLDTTHRPHGLMFEPASMASLDHAMWFHRPFRADEWLLYDQYSPSASGARGLATGRIFSRDGRLVVSVVQEGLIRIHAPHPLTD